MKIKTITADETLSLRSEVLRSGKPLAQCVFEGDKAVTPDILVLWMKKALS